MAVNYHEQRCFGAMQGQLQSFGWIRIIHKGDVGRVHINENLLHGFDAHSNKKSGQMGIFHKL